MANKKPIRVTVWHEHVHDTENETVKQIYPNGMHTVMADAIKEQLGEDNVQVSTALLEQPEHGLTDEVLANTDVMTWWGHAAHDKVDDKIVEKVATKVHEGMGLCVLHSGHFSKIFKKLMGTPCSLRWREQEETERIWCVNPGHPIADGLEDEYFQLEKVEMYGEYFAIPTPDELIFVSWFEGGEVFRSGAVWNCGKGKVFYWRPGHETFPLYYDKNVRRILANGVNYVAPSSNAIARIDGRNIKEPLSPITKK